jgi:hypothetical protein
VVAAALLFAPSAAAAPPSNDNRADAQLLPSFPALATGTTVEATVERLDPQVSDCGQIEATVWYRIDLAPDGRIVVNVRANPGLAPVVRIYRRGNQLTEVACGTAADGGTVVTSFQTIRGAGYFILVGRRPGAGDGTFDVTAELFLPPRNDRARDAQPLGKLPATLQGTTLAATGDESDGRLCGLAGGSVWYSFAGTGRRVVLRLQTEDALDASMTVFERVRSELEPVDCQPTDRRGNAVLAVDTEAGRSYLLVVGQRARSQPGGFTLTALAAEAPESLPGHRLVGGGVANSVHGLTDVNDAWFAELAPGTTYLIAFSSRACATVAVRPPRVHDRTKAPLLRLRCRDFTAFTPGPGQGGRYTFDVVSADVPKRQPYRLRVARAGVDDLGVGIELANGATARGRLAPRGADLVDIYHFDVPRTSDVTLGFSQRSGAFELVLLTDSGGRLKSSDVTIRTRLRPGRYVAAVRGRVGEAGGPYSLSLLLRDVTGTTLTAGGASSTQTTPGTTIVFSPSVSPPPRGGLVLLRIDRFDPLTGWHFHRLVRLAVGQSYSWTPPALGRWRASASFLGTSTSSPSRSGYVFVNVV